jgi:hypothetical protein
MSVPCDICKCLPYWSQGSGCCQAKPVKLNHQYKGGKLADIAPQKPTDFALEIPWLKCTKITVTQRLSR